MSLNKWINNKHKYRLKPIERAKYFSKKYPQYSPLVVHNNRLYGCWVIGAVHRKRVGYYGEYPYKLLDRILSLFPDCNKILHLFSGTTRDNPPNIITYDINPEFNPTICDDVRNLLKYKDILCEIDLCIADPPYENKDFNIYKQPPFNKAKVIRELGSIMKTGSYLVWLDVIVPIYNKQVWNLLGHIGIVVGTNTRVRCLSLWEHQ